MTQSKDIKEAKRRLFALLLDCSNDSLFDNEVDIMHHLSMDRDIQEILDKAVKLRKEVSLLSSHD